jgi:hypothetical protein
VSGAPTAAGTITQADLDRGEIRNAVCMAFSYTDQGGVNTSGRPHVAPAIADDVGGGPGPLCEGALLFAVGAMPGGLNEPEQMLWRACSTFGAYIVDKLDGQPMFYAESPQVGGAFTGGGLTAIGRTLRMVNTWG